MPMRTFFWSLLIALGTIPASQSVIAAQSNPPFVSRDEVRVTKEFQSRIKAFIQLENQLEHMLPGLKTTRNESEILEHQLALRKMVVDARRQARRGDIFTKDISRYFRAVIGEVLRSPAAPVIQRTIDGKEPSKPVVVRVNGVFPDDAPVQTTPPMLLMRLPMLPMELSYRFVGHDLVLLDNKTNLIVDFIPDILP